jgi:hypothetical protein
MQPDTKTYWTDTELPDEAPELTAATAVVLPFAERKRQQEALEAHNRRVEETLAESDGRRKNDPLFDLEQRLALRIKRNGGTPSNDMMCDQAAIKAVRSIGKKWRNTKACEYVAVGAMAARGALPRFDPAKGDLAGYLYKTADGASRKAASKDSRRGVTDLGKTDLKSLTHVKYDEAIPEHHVGKAWDKNASEDFGSAGYRHNASPNYDDAETPTGRGSAPGGAEAIGAAADRALQGREPREPFSSLMAKCGHSALITEDVAMRGLDQVALEARLEQLIAQLVASGVLRRRDAEMFEKVMDGVTQAELAKEYGCSQPTMNRRINSIKAMLEQAATREQQHGAV